MGGGFAGVGVLIAGSPVLIGSGGARWGRQGDEPRRSGSLTKFEDGDSKRLDTVARFAIEIGRRAGTARPSSQSRTGVNRRLRRAGPESCPAGPMMRLRSRGQGHDAHGVLRVLGERDRPVRFMGLSLSQLLFFPVD